MSEPVYLSTHFTLQELTFSETALHNNFNEQFNPPHDVVANLTALAVHVLEPLRQLVSTHFGKDTPLHINSAYRCARVNGAVPGSANHSQHLAGSAADVHVDGFTIEALYLFIKASNLPFGQLIQEHNLWVHISHDEGAQRGLCLRATGAIPAPVYQPDGQGAFKN